MAKDTPPPATGAVAPSDETEIDLSDIRWSDGVVLAVFWALAFVVFLQFFTRYVLNNSLGWTEEVARVLLIAVTFIGSIMATRKQTHIAVELFYRYLPRNVRFGMQIAVDVISAVFFAAMGILCVELATRTLGMMVSINVPKALIYWVVAACFGIMTVWAVVVLVQHWRSGTSRLIDPEKFAATGPNI